MPHQKEKPAGASGGADYDLRFAIENQAINLNSGIHDGRDCQDFWQDAVSANEIYSTCLALQTPRQAQIDALIALEITPEAMIFDWRSVSCDIRTAKVAWSGNRFDFADDGRPALIVMAFDEAGDLIDLVAFDSRGRIGAWLGNASVLGGENVLSPRMADGLTIHRNALDWLKTIGAVLCLLIRNWRGLRSSAAGLLSRSTKPMPKSYGRFYATNRV